MCFIFNSGLQKMLVIHYENQIQLFNTIECNKIDFFRYYSIQIIKKEDYSSSIIKSHNKLLSSFLSSQMVIKVRLIKPKKRQSQSFYKTSEIKYQTLSIPSLTKFRMRSTQKLIQFKSPWQQLDTQEINLLAERLQDRPEDLYGAVKENINQRKQVTRLKFNRLSINVAKMSKSPSQKSPLKIEELIEANQFSKIERAMRKGFINIEEKINQNKLLNKIKQKRKEYEREMKNMINDKRLILETDLPKINRIKAVNRPNHEILGKAIKQKLPVWKLR